ncbi:MAG: ABC transporter permease subunit [Bacteroidales bacterium]|nr:ABC transporter permease subunit [Bacteroidales bacterium]
MNRNLFLMEIKRNTLSLTVWMIAITVLVSVTMAVYPVFLENQSKILGMMSLIPDELLQFKGISDFSDFLSVLGFYSVNNIIYMMVLGSIYAIVLSSGILLKEEYNKTAEYLLTRPLTRSEIFLSKLAVLFINVFLLNFVTALAGFICLELVRNTPFSTGAFLILSLYTLLLNILFGAVGLFMSTLVRRARPITTLSIGLVLILYFIFTLSKITEGISRIGYLSPFRYVKTNATSPDYSLDFWHLLYFIGISLLLIGLSYRLYIRKDIYT